MKFHSLQLTPRSRQYAARNRDRLEIAFMFAALIGIVVLLIGGSRLLVQFLSY
jgi:hypothetical protein